jgi:hypothetical protein
MRVHFYLYRLAAFPWTSDLTCFTWTFPRSVGSLLGDGILGRWDCPPRELLKAQVISTLSGFEFSERERVEYTEMQSVSKAIKIQ